MRFISYAQSFEDVMLWRALKHIKTGFYIDVGANDPEVDSVTKAFYERGWYGINIEPLPSHHADLVKARPRDINLLCGAGSTRGEVQLWECDVRGWATASEDVVAMHLADGHHGTYHQVSILPLREVCVEYVVGDIHFMKIDVEGFEKNVIDGMDFKSFRPWILVIEATRPNSIEEIHWVWEQSILSANYIFAYADGLNRFYVANEHSELIENLRYPPNVFDQFIRSEQFESEVRAQHAEALAEEVEFRAEKYEARANELQASLEATSKDLHEALSSNHQHWQLAEARQQQIDALLRSRSWRITLPLRWLGYQARRLRDGGLGARIKAIVKKFAKPLIRRSIQLINTHPRLRRGCVGLAHKLGLYHRLRSLYFRLLPPASAMSQQQTAVSTPQYEESSHLSDRAMGVYSQLKRALEVHQNQAGQ